MPKIFNLAEANLDECYGRAEELREEFTKPGGISEGRRGNDPDHDKALKSMFEEIDSVDHMITLLEIQERRDRAQRASLAGGQRSGKLLTIGEMVANELAKDESDGLRRYLDFGVGGSMPETGEGGYIVKGTPSEAGGYRAGVSKDGPTIGQYDFSKDCFDIQLEGEAGRRALEWSRLTASGYGDSGYRDDSGYRVSSGASEWAAGGPPTGDSTGSSTLLPVGQPIPPVPRRARLWLRDLLPSMRTTLASVPYVQELNPASYEGASGATGGAGQVAEAGTKPSSQLSFQGQNARPTVIAATLVISKQLFEDSPAVVQYINGRLPYLTRFQEDNQFLNGNGTWPNLPGILNQSGVLSQAYYTQTGATTPDRAQTIGIAMSQVENHDGSPNSVVMNPTDAWTMFTNRAAGGSGTFDAGTPFSALPLTVWGVQSYRSRAYPALQALVGDFQLGGMIVDREQVNVQLYRERYAEQNLVLLICEERVGVMWFRPDLFVSTLLHP